MTIQFVGSTVGRPAVVTGLSGGIGSAAADGDWIFWWNFYPNTMTETWAAPSGWTLIRQTIGASNTVELWARQWHTGDPTSWTVTVTGYSSGNPDSGVVAVYRGLTGTPSIVSATHETSTSPAIADTVTDAGIGNNDVALGVFATHHGGFTGTTTPATDTGGANVGANPGVMVGGIRLTTAGSAPQIDASITGTPTDTFGLQLILPDTPLAAGWGVGQVRMGAN